MPASETRDVVSEGVALLQGFHSRPQPATTCGGSG